LTVSSDSNFAYEAEAQVFVVRYDFVFFGTLTD